MTCYTQSDRVSQTPRPLQPYRSATGRQCHLGRFNRERALMLGVVQVIAGLAVLILSFITLASHIWGLRYGSGFFSGIMFISSGMLGFISARVRTNRTVCAYIVLSTISVISALILLTLCAIGLAAEEMMREDLKERDGVSVVIHSLIIVSCIVESISGSAASIIGCYPIIGYCYISPTGPCYVPASGRSSTGGIRRPVSDAPNQMPLLVPSLDESALPEPVVVLDSPTDASNTSNRLNTHHFAIIAPMYQANSGPDPQDGTVLYSSENAFAIPPGQEHTINQLMYIMPPGVSVPQPGSMDNTCRPNTPPPTYSQIDLTTVGTTNDNTNCHQTCRNGIITSNRYRSYRRRLRSVMDVAFREYYQNGNSDEAQHDRLSNQVQRGPVLPNSQCNSTSIVDNHSHSQSQSYSSVPTTVNDTSYNNERSAYPMTAV